jgi:hypothetical protein
MRYADRMQYRLPTPRVFADHETRPAWRRSGSILCCHRSARTISPAVQVAAVASNPQTSSFLRRPGWESFRAVLTDLRSRCPAAMPVVIRAAWLPDNLLGECVRRRHRFVVRLNDQMGEDQAIEVLCHEWAHALAWNYSLDQLANVPDLDPAEFDRASHDEAWGCAYARVWRAYLEGGRAEG